MRTSVSGISTDAAPASAALADRTSRRGARGFTLIELLVVVTIIGLLAGAVLLSTGSVRADRDVEREVNRLRSLVELAREEAVMQSREHAILFTETGYRFYVYDYQTEQWAEPPGDALLAPRELEAPISLELRAEDRDLVLDAASLGLGAGEDEDEDDDAPQPQVMILSSGEMTPFEASFVLDTIDARMTLAADLAGSLTISKDGWDGR